MQPLTRSLSIALLVGTVLLGVGAVLHPILPPDPCRAAPDDRGDVVLPTDPSRDARRDGAASSSGSGRERSSVRRRRRCSAALALVSLGLCFNAIDIAFMASAGNQLASLAQAGNAERGHAVRLAAPRRAHDGALRELPRGARRDRAELGGAPGEHALAVATGVDRGVRRDCSV